MAWRKTRLYEVIYSFPDKAAQTSNAIRRAVRFAASTGFPGYNNTADE